MVYKNLTKRIESRRGYSSGSGLDDAAESHKENWKINIPARYLVFSEGISQRELKGIQFSKKEVAKMSQNLTKRIESWIVVGLKGNLNASESHKENWKNFLLFGFQTTILESHKENWKRTADA